VTVENRTLSHREFLIDKEHRSKRLKYSKQLITLYTHRWRQSVLNAGLLAFPFFHANAEREL
jgi:hypothetical protein